MRIEWGVPRRRKKEWQFLYTSPSHCCLRNVRVGFIVSAYYNIALWLCGFSLHHHHVFPTRSAFYISNKFWTIILTIYFCGVMVQFLVSHVNGMMAANIYKFFSWRWLDECSFISSVCFFLLVFGVHNLGKLMRLKKSKSRSQRR